MGDIKPRQQLQPIRKPVRLSLVASNTQAAGEWGGGLGSDFNLLWKGGVNEYYTCLLNVLKLTCPGNGGGLIRALVWHCYLIGSIVVRILHPVIFY